jgi:hypothetical protein
MTDNFEQFDEDNVGLDPLEEGMDPPEHWAQADRFGNTEREVREGQDLDHRLAEEQPDIEPEPPPERPWGATPDDELDESIDDRFDEPEPIVPEEPDRREPDAAVRSGTSANQAGGSVAEEIRTPPDQPV